MRTGETHQLVALFINTTLPKFLQSKVITLQPTSIGCRHTMSFLKFIWDDAYLNCD